MIYRVMLNFSYKQFRKLTEDWIIPVGLCSILVGYLIGSSFRKVSENEVEALESINSDWNKGYMVQFDQESVSSAYCNFSSKLEISNQSLISSNATRVFVKTNPRGAERLPPNIIQPHSDFNQHYETSLSEEEDTATKPKYLLALAVGLPQKHIVNEIVKKFSENFKIMLFHYDEKASEWDQFEWSRGAIHVSARKQTKWWYAKRFLHPDIVASYEYIFIWDEDLGVENFNAEEYLKLVKKHDLEISQPGIESNKGFTWSMTKRRTDVEVHKEVAEQEGWCSKSTNPPCAGFVEIMAPVFSRKAWRCVWHMIQNDLVHGWGVDLNMWRCIERPHEKMGVVDAQWIEHKVVPSLGEQGESIGGKSPWEGVRARCFDEMEEYRRRIQKAEDEYHQHQH